jgi:Methylene-tetrahydrofolate reductase C terminal
MFRPQPRHETSSVTTALGDGSARSTADGLEHRAHSPHPRTPRASARLMFGLHSFLEPNFVWRRLARFLERRPRLYRLFAKGEEATKSWLFGCRMCGQCALPTTAYACPQSCPKQLRNGPCGGVSPDGHCEVYPEERCVWVVAYERAEATGHVKDLRRLVRPIDQSRWGESSWVNFWLDRDEDLWTSEDAVAATAPPSL